MLVNKITHFKENVKMTDEFTKTIEYGSNDSMYLHIETFKLQFLKGFNNCSNIKCLKKSGV